jgi:hypothetical protein
VIQDDEERGRNPQHLESIAHLGGATAARGCRDGVLATFRIAGGARSANSGLVHVSIVPGLHPPLCGDQPYLKGMRHTRSREKSSLREGGAIRKQGKILTKQ